MICFIAAMLHLPLVLSFRANAGAYIYICVGVAFVAASVDAPTRGAIGYEREFYVGVFADVAVGVH